MDHPWIIRYNKNCLTLRCNEALRKEAEPRVEFKPLYFSSPFHEWKYVPFVLLCLFLFVYIFPCSIHGCFLEVNVIRLCFFPSALTLSSDVQNLVQLTRKLTVYTHYP